MTRLASYFEIELLIGDGTDMDGTIRYTIRPYDTVWMLAQIFNTTVDSIMDLNPGIDPRNLMIGQVITIRPGYQNYPAYPVAPGTSANTGVGNGQDGRNDGSSTNTRDNMDNRNGVNDRNSVNNRSGVNDSNSMNSRNGINDRNNMDNRNNVNNRNSMDSRNGMNDRDWQESDGLNHEAEGNMMDMVNYFRLLWEQHVEWTRMTFMAAIHQLPDAEQILQRLLRNAMDFANALAAFYGDEAAEEFERLFTEHIRIAGELVQAAMAGDNGAVADADRRWHENADQIARLLAGMNPYWSEEDWSAMLYEHLELLRSDIENMLAGNYEESINGYDEIEMQALEMADMMAEGIAMQFPW